MDFSCLSPNEVRLKYDKADDKNEMICVLADLTASTTKDIMEFLGVRRSLRLDDPNVVELYESGMTDREISMETGVTVDVVKAWRKRNGGLPPNKKVVGTTQQTKDMERYILYMDGLSDSQIADQVGVQTGTITKWRKKCGLTSNWGKNYLMTN